jgi:hypothetical protein
MQVFDKSILRIIFGRKAKEVTAGWRILGSEDLHDLYTSLNIIIVM